MRRKVAAAAAGGPVQDAVLPAGTEFDHHRRERQQDSRMKRANSQDLTDILRSEAGGGGPKAVEAEDAAPRAGINRRWTTKVETGAMSSQASSHRYGEPGGIRTHGPKIKSHLIQEHRNRPELSGSIRTGLRTLMFSLH
jgi:hypothetical protein